MTDFAQLVLSAESTGLKSGEQALISLATTAERTENRTGKAMTGLSKATEQVGKQSIFATQQLRTSAMQLSQVAQQASATGNVMQALAIQLPDLALGFGPIGIAAGAAAGAILSYFATYEGGQDTTEILKEQEDLIRRVAERWGEAAPALQTYVDILDEAKRTSDDLATQQAFAEQEFKAPREGLSDLVVGFDDLLSKLRVAGEEQENIISLEDAFQSLRGAVEANQDPTDELAALQVALASATNSSGIPAIQDFTSVLYGFGNAALTAAGNVNTLIQQMSAAQTMSSIRGLNAPLGYENSSTPDPTTDIPTPTSRGTPELSGFPWEKIGASRGGGRGRKSGGGGKSEAENYETIVEAANRRIASLRAEFDAIGMTEEAAEKLRNETDLFNDAQQKGIKLTDDQRTNLSTLAESMANLEQQTRAAKEQQDFFNDISEDLKSGIIDSIVEGEKLSDTFEDIGKSIAKAALEAALFGSGPFAGGSGGAGGLLGGIFKLFSFDGGGYTGSGSRSGGVDGKGGFPAILHPQESIVDHTKGGTGGQQTTKVEVVSRFDANGNFESNVERISQRVSGSAVRQGIGEYDRNLPGRFNDITERQG